MYVTKRNGEREILDISKIRKQTHPATDGLEVSSDELEVDAKIQFRDGITTEEIQQTLIKTAVDKIDIDTPQWTYVAARLFLFDIYHKVGFTSFQDYIKRAVEKGKYHPDFWKGYDLDELADYIEPIRDYQFNYLGVKTLYDRYLLKDDNGVAIETPQQMFMSIAMFLAQNEENKMMWAKRFYDVLSKFEVMVATPTLSNARTPRHQLSSCYLGVVGDNIESIFDTYKDYSLLSKFGGGIGWDWSSVRAIGGEIDGFKKVAGGVIPFLKITNDIAIAVDQLGVRKGSIAVYTQAWHLDILDFIDLKKNSGEERRRTHDLFPALWLNDLFMERVLNGSDWTLFDPYEVPDLVTAKKDEFKDLYEKYEADTTKRKVTIKAKDLWKRALVEYTETGNPFLCFKDTFNNANPNPHIGTIRSSNLCLEIAQVTEPAAYGVKVTFIDGSEIIYKENELVTTDKGTKKYANKLTQLDSLSGNKVVRIDKVKVDEGRIAVCNLASINLSKVNSQSDLERVVPIAIRMLDNVIDLNFYPIPSTQLTNLKSRAIGLGAMGEAQYLAENQIHWGSKEHFEKIDEIYEIISFNAIMASADLAKEKGSYPEFNGSNWSKGLVPFDYNKDKWANTVKYTNGRELIYNWDELKAYIQGGMRNGYLMAIAPTSSISILTGTTQGIEPVYKRKWFEENLSGLIPVTAPNLNPNNYMYYTPAYEIDQTKLVVAAAIRQKWIDQSQSLNIFIDPNKTTGKDLHDIYTLGWSLGVKSFYYLRSKSPEAAQDEVMDRSMECVGCQ